MPLLGVSKLVGKLAEKSSTCFRLPLGEVVGKAVKFLPSYSWSLAKARLLANDMSLPFLLILDTPAKVVVKAKKTVPTTIRVISNSITVNPSASCRFMLMLNYIASLQERLSLFEGLAFLGLII